jgi:hypothetical protein
MCKLMMPFFLFFGSVTLTHPRTGMMNQLFEF